MELIDYALNDLLKPLGGKSVKFIPSDQSSIFREALHRLHVDGYAVHWLDLAAVDGEGALLERFSETVAGPSAITNWGIFEDWLNDLSWIPARKPGHFFFMSNALGMWRHQTLVAAALTEELQTISFQWAKSGVRFVGVYELC